MKSGKVLRCDDKKKNNFIEKYDMHKYYVTLHSKDNKMFYLVPMPQYELN
jgi:hypothetical protein